MAAASWPMPPASRPTSSATSRSGPTGTRRRSSWPSGSPRTRQAISTGLFFTTGGGEAVESAWKLARQYFKATGEPGRYKVISRDIAYHGATMGALSITGLAAIKNVFEPLVPGSVRVPNTNFYRAPEHGDSYQDFSVWAAAEIERAILREGPESVAAVFVEPVQNSGGCFPPPARLPAGRPRDLHPLRPFSWCPTRSSARSVGSASGSGR